MSGAPVARARACLGTRFRVHGRVPGCGLDCVGLVAFAHAIADAPAGYAMRGGARDRIEDGLRAAGFAAAPGAGPGDVLLIESGAFQHHLAIATRDGFIHADAGIGRVVEVPGAPRWPVLSTWRRG